MKRSLVILIHIGFWLCYSLLIIIVLGVYSRSFDSNSYYLPKISNALKNLALFAIIPSVISYVVYYFLLFPGYFQRKKYFIAIVFGLFTSISTAILFYMVHRFLIESGYVIDMDNGGRNGRSTAPLVILVMTFIGAICGVVAFVIRGFITWFEEVRLRELLREKNLEIEMALIKSQLDPHLLFNTINNIDALMLKDAIAASDYLNKLSDIMRFILYETKTEKISLSRELEYIGKYIDLQKIRTANEEYVQYAVSGNADGKLISPMVFIPFIENAFKHSSNKKVRQAIKVHVHIDDETTSLFCENRFESRSTEEKLYGGLGNQLIAKRLNLTYPNRHKLNISKSEDNYSVTLTIPHG